MTSEAPKTPKPAKKGRKRKTPARRLKSGEEPKGQSRTRGMTPERQVEAMRKHQEVIDLRAAGWSFQQIAELLNEENAEAIEAGEMEPITLGAVIMRFKRAVEWLKAELAPVMEDILYTDIQTLDAIIQANLPNALKGDPAGCQTVQKAIDQRRKILGVDGPIKIAQTNAAGEDIPIDEALIGARFVEIVPASADGSDPAVVKLAGRQAGFDKVTMRK